MKKTLVRIMGIFMAVVLVVSAAGLMGCASSSDYATQESINGSYYEPEYEYTGDYDLGFTAGDIAEAPSAPKEESSETSTETTEDEFERKIIRNADISISADDANLCYNAILTYAKSLGGYESNFNSNSNDYSGSVYIYIDLELRLPPEKLDEFVAEIKNGEYGEVTNCAVTSDEITEQYYDLETRLASKEKSLESYYALLEKAETVDDILTIQYHIDTITEEIEAIKGKLRLFDSLVDESKVSITISQYTPAPIEEKEFEWDSLSAGDFFRLIKNGFLGVCNFVWSALLWITIIIISLLPVLAVAGIVLAVVFGIRKKSKKNKNKSDVKTAEVSDPGDEVKTDSAPDYK